MSSGVNKTFLMKVDGKPNDFNYQTIHFTLGRSSLASVETFLNNYSNPSMCLEIENVISPQLICFSPPAPHKLSRNSRGVGGSVQ